MKRSVNAVVCNIWERKSSGMLTIVRNTKMTCTSHRPKSLDAASLGFIGSEPNRVCGFTKSSLRFLSICFFSQLDHEKALNIRTISFSKRFIRQLKKVLFCFLKSFSLQRSLANPSALPMSSVLLHSGFWSCFALSLFFFRIWKGLPYLTCNSQHLFSQSWKELEKSSNSIHSFYGGGVFFVFCFLEDLFDTIQMSFLCLWSKIQKLKIGHALGWTVVNLEWGQRREAQAKRTLMGSASSTRWSHYKWKRYWSSPHYVLLANLPAWKK